MGSTNTAIFPKAAHLRPPKGSRKEAKHRAFPMAERPDFEVASSLVKATPAERALILRKAIEWLSVDTSARWLPRDSSTYCNCYAADATLLFGAYLPRVWWTRSALSRIRAGEDVEAIYPYGSNEGTIRESNANSFRDWLSDFGSGFGWELFEGAETKEGRLERARRLRDACNATGSFGLVVARRKDRNRSGHITVALPDAVSPATVGLTSPPLQSQAGTRNRRLFSSDWFTGTQFDATAFAVFTFPKERCT